MADDTVLQFLLQHVGSAAAVSDRTKALVDHLSHTVPREELISFLASLQTFLADEGPPEIRSERRRWRDQKLEPFVHGKNADFWLAQLGVDLAKRVLGRVEPWVYQYPLNGKEHPFCPTPRGRYFAYLTNRSTPMSLLSEHISDFEYMHPILHCAIQMGYTNLWVMERTILFGPRQADSPALDDSPGSFWLFVRERQVTVLETEYSSLRAGWSAGREQANRRRRPILLARRLENHMWH